MSSLNTLTTKEHNAEKQIRSNTNSNRKNSKSVGAQHEDSMQDCSKQIDSNQDGSKQEETRRVDTKPDGTKTESANPVPTAAGVRVLLVTGIEGAANCAHAMSSLLGVGAAVEVAGNRREALAALRKREFTVVVVEESLAECDSAGAEQLWKSAGGAMPIQVNFALAGTNRIAREIRAAASRREREQEMARQAAVGAMEQDLRTTVAGLLLHSELALASSKELPHLAERLRTVVDLAGNLRQQLGGVEAGR